MQGAIGDQLVNLPRAQRGDPLQARHRTQLLLDAGLGEHAAVPDQHHLFKRKALAQFGNLRGHGGGVSGVARKHLHRHRTTLGIRQHAEDNLRIAAPLVTRMSVAGQRTAVSLKVGRADVVEHQAALAQMAAGQGCFDRALLG